MAQFAQALARGLTVRHIRFMALGSAIGTGLFYGSAAAIQAAGPAVLLAYAIGGAAVFLVMRALGEMAVRHPVSGSFGQYASRYLGPFAGFVTGWTFVFEMVVVAIAYLPFFLTWTPNFVSPGFTGASQRSSSSHPAVGPVGRRTNPDQRRPGVDLGVDLDQRIGVAVAPEVGKAEPLAAHVAHVVDRRCAQMHVDL